MTEGSKENTGATPGRINLVKIGGIRITLDYSWFIIFFLVFWTLTIGYFPHYFPGYSLLTYVLVGTTATLLFFISLLIHELAHSFVAMRNGIGISEITLFVFGGVSNISEEPDNPRTELGIAFVGPLSSFVLALIFWGITAVTRGTTSGIVTALFSYLAWINFALGIFNLVPAFPMDGGRVFRALWWWKSHSLTTATKVASDLGQIFAIFLMILGIVQIIQGFFIAGIWLIFIGFFLRSIAQGGYQELLMRKSLEGVEVREVMVTDIVTIPPEITVDEAINRYFIHYGYRSFPVTQDNKIIGMLSLSNLKEIPAIEQTNTTVREVMDPVIDDDIVSPQERLSTVLGRIYREKINRFLVMSGDKLIGLVTKRSLLRFLELKGFSRQM